MKRDYTFNWRELTAEQQLQVLDQWSKTANRRLRRLRENGIDYWSTEAGQLLKSMNRKTFANSKSKFIKEDPRRRFEQLEIIQHFLTGDYSTLSGIKRQMASGVYDRVMKRLNIALPKENKFEKFNIYNVNKFYDFLHSEVFKTMREYIDSDILVKDYMAYYQSYTIDEISKAYEDYNKNEVDQEYIQQVLEENRRKK